MHARMAITSSLGGLPACLATPPRQQTCRIASPAAFTGSRRALGSRAAVPRRSVVSRVGNGGGSSDPSERERQRQLQKQLEEQRKKDEKIIYGIGILLALSISAVALLYGEEVQDFMLYSDLGGVGVDGLGPGDAFGAALWGVALWFTSPLQLLLLFLGRIDTERPSDWLLNVLGRALGNPVEAVDYAAPGALRLAVAALCALSGTGIAAALNYSLGDATWGVSSGIGACMAAGIYEIGRPERLSVERAVELEGQWQDFAQWADGGRLARSGRCHETEVFRAFRRSFGRYRSEEAISDATLRDMVRNWHPGAQRSSSGYYKNLSVVAVADAFTGAPPPSAAATATATANASASNGSAGSSSGSSSSSGAAAGQPAVEATQQTDASA